MPAQQPIDYGALQAAPGTIQSFVVESPTLPKLGWLPTNGRPGTSPVYTDAAQDFARSPAQLGPSPYPYTIGYIMGLLPLMDIWKFGQNVARLPFGPYTGGDYIREQGRTEFGVNSAPLAVRKLLG